MFVHSEKQRRLSNRSSLLRPDRTVQIRLQFLNFGTINTVNEVFRATVLMKARWTDARRINIYDPDIDWNPRLYIENGQTISTVNWVEETRYELRHFDEYTEITEIRSITGDFWERMELHDFPLGINYSCSVFICKGAGTFHGNKTINNYPNTLKAIPWRFRPWHTL